MNKLSERMGMLDQGRKQPVNKNSRSKGVHKTKADSKKERKGKIKAIDEFLKAAEEIKTPAGTTAKQASKAAVEATITQEEKEIIKQKAVKRSHAKFKKVLQFMEESGDKTIAELMESTEEKIKNSRSTSKIGEMQVSQTESETLQLLFNKMKEEVVFNEYTKNVLDQKDSQKTKKAKAKLYDAREAYMKQQRKMLLDDDALDELVTRNQEYGVDKTNVGKLISGGTAGLVDSLSDNQIQNILNKNKGISLENQGKQFSSLDVTEKNRVKNRVSDFLDKRITGLDELKNLRKQFKKQVKQQL